MSHDELQILRHWCAHQEGEIVDLVAALVDQYEKQARLLAMVRERMQLWKELSL